MKKDVKKQKEANNDDESECIEDHENVISLLKMKRDKLDKEMEKIKASTHGRVGQVFNIVKQMQGSEKDKTNADSH